jgi:sugar/nucleoside kinase (ribokinase family)
MGRATGGGTGVNQREASGAPDVVVVGAATRDIDPADPRGWRLGGGVTYGALACARLGLRTGVLLGLDSLAYDAHELRLLEVAGVDLRRVPLDTGPVFQNVEQPGGRVQTCLSTSAPVPVESLPDGWRAARSWLLAPVASEVPDAWADVPTPDAVVLFGWQGVLRHLAAGERVSRLAPQPSPLLGRSDIAGVSRHDVPHDLPLASLLGMLRPGARLLLTAGERGGALLHLDEAGRVRGRSYPPIPARMDVDPTGAGDATLAGILVGRLVLGPDGPWEGRAAHLAALAGSLLVEDVGLPAVPTRHAIRERSSA